MGRHSTPDNEPDELAEDASGDVLVDDQPSSGRHSEPVAAEPEGPQGPPDAPAAPTAEVAAVDAPPAPAQTPRSRHSTAADLGLLKSHGDVRARCLAGIVVPFVIYVAVLLAIGATGRQYLLWIFIPIVVAGVLVGAFLDAGFKRYPRG